MRKAPKRLTLHANEDQPQPTTHRYRKPSSRPNQKSKHPPHATNRQQTAHQETSKAADNYASAAHFIERHETNQQARQDSTNTHTKHIHRNENADTRTATDAANKECMHEMIHSQWPSDAMLGHNT